MSREFAKAAPTYWLGDTGRTIKRLGGAHAQLLGQYLMSCPHGSSFGLYRLPMAYVLNDLAMTEDEALAAFVAIEAAGFARYDVAREVVFVKNMAAQQIVEELEPGDRKLKWIVKEVSKLARMPFFTDFLARYAEPWAPALGGFEVPSPAAVCPIDAPSMPHVSPMEGASSDAHVCAAPARDALTQAYSGSGSGSGLGQGYGSASASEVRTRVPKSPVAIRTEALRLGYVSRFERVFPGIAIPDTAQPMSGGPWLELARALTDAQVDPLLDAFFADEEKFTRDRAPGKISSQRVRLLTDGPTIGGVARPLATRPIGTDPVSIAQAARDAAEKELSEARRYRDSLSGGDGHAEAVANYLRKQRALGDADDALEAAKRRVA